MKTFGQVTYEFATKHEFADELIYDEKTHRPLKAVYHCPSFDAYENFRRFWAAVSEEESRR